MPTMYMTRGDEVGVGPYDSIKWLFETALKMEDDLSFNFAIAIGPNEDSITEIMFWHDEPLFNQKPDRHYKLILDKEYGEFGWQSVTI